MKLMKNKDGYQAVTMFPFDETRTMRISTSKYLGDLCTTASVVTLTEYGFSHVIFKDWTALIEREKTRVTSGAVKKQHEDALKKIDACIQSAQQFYEHQRN
jgi:hypothetical protein